MHPDFTTPSAPEPQLRTAGEQERARAELADRVRGALATNQPRPDVEPYGYVRVSTIMQRIKGYSLPKQLKDLAAAACADGNPVEGGNLLGDADSGCKGERRGLQTLLLRAREGRVSVVYFAKVDRIGRNARDSLNIVHELSQLGVRIVVVDPRLDTKDPFGYFLFVIRAAMAELKATFILERTMGGKLEQLTQDEQTGRAPRPAARKPRYGFRYLAPTKKGEDGTWVHDLEEKRWIWIYEEVARGRGSDDVAADLTTRRVPSPGGTRWDGTAVCRIVRSTMYVGKMVRRMGGTEFVFDVPPMAPPALFAMANEALDANKKRSRRNAKAEYLLNSTRDDPLLKCRVCHHRGEEHIMGGRRVRHKGTADRYTHFDADWHWEGPKKAQHRVPGRKLENAVWEALTGMIRDPDIVLARFARLADEASKEAREIADELAALDEAANENRLAQRRLIEMASRGRLAPDLIDKQEDKLAREADETAQRRALLGVQLERARDSQAPIAEVRDACALLADGMAEADFAQKRWLIRHLVRVIYADKEGWKLEGRLPGMHAEGVFPAGSFEEHTS